MKYTKILLIALFSFLIFKSYLSKTYASEGTFDIQSTTSDTYKCWAASLRMQNLNYSIVIGCRDLLYPAGENIYTYIVWATPREGDKPIKLGALGFGKAQFATKTPFTQLYVTTELNANTKSPEGPVVMRGSVRPISFLEIPTTPTPTPEGEEGPVEPETTPIQSKSFRERLVLGFRRAGLAALLAIIAIIGLVYVLTKSRG